MLIRAGSTNSLTGGTVVTVSHFVQNPGYAANPRANDIAVTFLANPLGISATINVLYLPPNNFYIADGFTLNVVGWGFDAVSKQIDFGICIINFNLRKFWISKSDYLNS